MVQCQVSTSAPNFGQGDNGTVALPGIYLVHSCLCSNTSMSRSDLSIYKMYCQKIQDGWIKDKQADTPVFTIC